MRFLACTVDVDPCPAANVTTITLNDALDFTALGITPEQILFVFGWGFSAILMGFLAGYGVRLAIGMIRKI